MWYISLLQSGMDHERNAEICGTYLCYSLAWTMKGMLKYLVHIFATVWHGP